MSVTYCKQRIFMQIAKIKLAQVIQVNLKSCVNLRVVPLFPVIPWYRF